MNVKFKVWLENKGEVVLSNGKVGILKKIDQLGSIQKAAEEFGMSYRHAWGAIRKIEKRAGFKIVDTKLGGKEQERAQLTSRGKIFIETMDSLLKDLQEIVENRFKKKFGDFSLKRGN